MGNQNIVSQVAPKLPKGQEHILAHIESAPQEAAEKLKSQINATDWNSLSQLVTPPVMDDVQAPDVVRLSERGEHSVTEEGMQAYRDGRVASLIVAGGQGTRLGFDGPKGCFTVPELEKSIFEIHLGNHRALCEKYDRELPLLIMTGLQNDQETKDFLSENNYYGLKASQVHFFTQASVPSFAENGKLVLKAEDSLLMNPNGHGGSVDALISSGILQTVMEQGVQFINYIQVDNILSKLDDAFAIGLAVTKDLDAITKVVKKSNAEEKVGHLVKVEGKDQIVEYSSLTSEQKLATDENGELLMGWGNTAMHVWKAQFLMDRGESPLPYNVSALKDAEAYVDGETRTIKVKKFERFIFDLLRLTEKTLSLEVQRSEEFAPVKNATGVDSPETAVELYKNATL